MSDLPDLAILGAGPAGMAAAAEATALGLSVLLLDEKPTPGGAVYHAVTRSPLRGGPVLDDDYWRGEALATGLAGVDYRPGSQVWAVDRDGSLGVTQGGRARILRARRILLATGTMERPMPFPGWTLPGVMTAGAGQVLLKEAGSVPDGPVVLAGTGPLLLLLGAQYLKAGAKIAALVDLTPPGALRRGLPHLLRAAGAPGYLRKGIGLLAAPRRAGVPVLRGVTGLAALGEGRLEAVEVRQGAATRRIDAAVMLTHCGVVPGTVFTRLLRLPHAWDAAQRCWRVEAEAPWGATALDTIAVAGDGLRILGAEAAAHSGRLAAMDTAHRLGKLTLAARDARAAPELAGLARHAAVRPFLDSVFAPPDWIPWADDATLLCRCEEVTVGVARAAIRGGSRDPNQVKALTRCGMGPCQGRQCGQPLAQLVAQETGQGEAQVPPPRARPPLRRLTIGELAALEVAE